MWALQIMDYCSVKNEKGIQVRLVDLLGSEFIYARRKWFEFS